MQIDKSLVGQWIQEMLVMPCTFSREQQGHEFAEAIGAIA